MIAFRHTITAPQGLHARLVVVICRAVLDHQSAVTVSFGDRRASGSDMVGLMGLDARCGDTLAFEIEGPDEDEAARDLRQVCADQL